MSKPWAMVLIVSALYPQVALAQPPVRRFDDSGAPPFTVLKAGENPPLDVDGNFVIGPEYTPAPARKAVEGVAHGRVTQFTIDSKETKLFNPGIARQAFGKVDPANSKTLIVETHPIDYKRQITVYVPVQYQAGSEAPFMVCHDGPKDRPNSQLPQILDNLIAQKRIPPMIAIQIGNGGQDAQGSQRGKEYDAVNGVYTQFVEREVLPLVEKNAGVKLTRNPDGRASLGLSSSGAAAFTMAWFHPELYRRVLAYSPTMVNQQWPYDPALRGGAWEYHSPWAGPAGPNLHVKNPGNAITPGDPAAAPLIPSVPAKPIRFWFAVGDQDLFYPNPVMVDGMHDWVLAAELMAKVLADKGYHYQFVFARNSKHVDRPTVAQTLPAALEWLWKGYPLP